MRVCVTNPNCWPIGNTASVLNPWNGFLEPIRMIKLLEAKYLDDFQVALVFSDGQEGVFDGCSLPQRSGPLLEPLHAESYFRRLFVDAGALCWPNGLELSPARLHEACSMMEASG